MHIAQEQMDDLNAIKDYSLKKSIEHSGVAGSDFAVIAQYVNWLIGEIYGNQHTTDECPLKNTE